MRKFALRLRTLLGDGGGGTAVTAAEDRAIALAPADRLVLAYTIALGALAGLCAVRVFVIVAIAALAAAVVLIARLASVSRVWSLIHDFAVVAFVPVLYGITGPVAAAVNPARWDAQLAALDRAWFGELPAAWIGLWGRPAWLIEVASGLYATYYVIPLAIAVALYRANRRAEFDSFVFAVAATFVASYAGYLLAPATGPRVVPGHGTAPGGQAMGAWLQSFLDFFEWNRLDAFPSGHTALTLVYLVLGWRLLPHWRWRVPLAAAAVGIVFSTVYLSLHYVVDLLAGAILAALVLAVTPALHRFLLRSESPPRAVANARFAQRPSSKARQAPSTQPIRSKRPPR